MIKKDVQFKWTSVEKEAFDKLKDALVVTTALQSPDLSKDFLLYVFTLDHSLATVLT